MATSFPSGLDSFVNPSASDALDSGVVPHAAQHANANDAIEAIETKLGIGAGTIGTWTDFTPVFATGFTIGNATVIAKYATINDVVFVYVNILFGSTTSVSGEVLFTLPVTAGDSFSATASLMGVAYDNSATETYPLAPRPYATTGVRIRAIDTSGATAKSLILSSTAPFTWTTNDRLVFTTYYEKG
jgi:hypothetical protein